MQSSNTNLLIKFFGRNNQGHRRKWSNLALQGSDQCAILLLQSIIDEKSIFFQIISKL